MGEVNNMSILTRNLKMARKLKGIPVLPAFIQKVNRLLFSCDIPYQAKIHESVRFGHGGLGVVIHPKSSIGKNTLIMPHVVLGGNAGKFIMHEGEVLSYPIIGENVFIGTGAKIFGAVFIGDNAQIGAGAIVTKDVPKNGVALGTPAGVVKILDDNEVLDVTKV